MYLWVKTIHLVFVIAWMATVFYLPRILVNLAETTGQPDVQARLLLMGRRLYGFGHSMFGIAVILGGVLWFYFGISGGWLHAKLTLVALVLAHFIITGRWLKGVAKGKSLPAPTALKWFNELPLFALIAIVWLVLAKPF
ncbi:MAG TPA: CopD family protein [Pseudoxanthomonas sp.]